MASDITLYLREDFLKTDAIILEAEGYEKAEGEDFEELDRGPDDSALLIAVDKNTGEVLQIVIEGFVKETEHAVKMLREYPLAWTFSLPSLKIKEKPLEDVLLAIWKKYKNIKMEWE